MFIAMYHRRESKMWLSKQKIHERKGKNEIRQVRQKYRVDMVHRVRRWVWVIAAVVIVCNQAKANTNKHGHKD